MIGSRVFPLKLPYLEQELLAMGKQFVYTSCTTDVSAMFSRIKRQFLSGLSELN